MKFGAFLKATRIQLEKTMEEVAKQSGVTAPYIGQLERGKKPPQEDTLERIIVALGASKKDADQLRRLAKIERTPEDTRHIVQKVLGGGGQIIEVPDNEAAFTKVPLLGVCPASPKMWVADEVDGWYFFPNVLVGKRRVYLLRVVGDSMNRVVQPGDIVMVDADAEPKHGEIVVVCSDSEYTMKRFSVLGNKILLSPDSTNSGHQPIIVDKKNEVRMRGVVRSIVMREIK